MIERLLSKDGREERIKYLLRQEAVEHNREIAEALEVVAEFMPIPEGTVIIEQGASDTDVFLIIKGSFNVVLNGHRIAGTRHSNEHVGEMNAVEPLNGRATTVQAREHSIVAKVSGVDFMNVVNRFPAQLYPPITRKLCKRLYDRNQQTPDNREHPRVFVISSTETRETAQRAADRLRRDGLEVVPWFDPNFFVTGDLTLERLEQAVIEFDFAVALVTSDDLTVSRGAASYSPRDNVIFEIGLFMGQLGRNRILILRPESEPDKDFQLSRKVPSDLLGLFEVRFQNEEELKVKLNAEAEKMLELGPLPRMPR